MIRRVLVRLLGIAFVLVAVTLIVHSLIHIVPGDPVDSIVGQSVTEADRAALRTAMGLDRSPAEQYIAFVDSAVRLDFGASMITKKPIGKEIITRFPRTAKLAAAAVLIAVLIGIGAGAVTALYPRTLLDRGVMILAVAGVSAPVFVTALVLRYLLAERYPILPPAGHIGWLCIILPALTLGSRSAGYLARITRATLLEILSEDYIRTARAKGLSKAGALFHHAFPNAAAPLLSVVVLDLAMYLNGSVITETLFAWPGLGRFALDSILKRDLPSVQAVTLVMAVTYVLAMALADLLRSVADPRLRS